MCGLPRSGKTTWISENKKGEIIVSADDLRYRVYDKSYWHQGENLVWWTREILLRTLMSQGVDIIIDETNTTAARRKPIVDLCKGYNYECKCVFIPASVDLCISRLIESNMHLESVIARMADKFEAPEKLEGIDEIVEIET